MPEVRITENQMAAVAEIRRLGNVVKSGHDEITWYTEIVAAVRNLTEAFDGALTYPFDDRIAVAVCHPGEELAQLAVRSHHDGTTWWWRTFTGDGLVTSQQLSTFYGRGTRIVHLTDDAALPIAHATGIKVPR